MRFAVEQWQTEYGTPVENLGDEAKPEKIDLEVEAPADAWAPIGAKPGNVVSDLLFVDGVRRIEARVWMEGPDGPTMGLCASCAAGVVRCDGAARVEDALVNRVLITPRPDGDIVTRHARYGALGTVDDNVETLMNALAGSLSALEVQVAEAARNAPLVVLDGPLRGRERVPGAMGYIKSHRVAYLEKAQAQVVAALLPSERTPVFFVETSWKRYSWYMRLPGGQGHPWAGIVRCEAPPTLSKHQAIELADRAVATLPRFASEPHKDGRAPQNLYPIKGLEDYLRSRLGNQELLYRSILAASS